MIDTSIEFMRQSAFCNLSLCSVCNSMDSERIIDEFDIRIVFLILIGEDHLSFTDSIELNGEGIFSR